jgi:hypothetical protein
MGQQHGLFEVHVVPPNLAVNQTHKQHRFAVLLASRLP